VLGLLGQVNGDALVIESRQMLLESIDNKKVNLQGPIEVFSQTTKSPSEYAEICTMIKEAMARYHGIPVYRFESTSLFTAHNTICRQVASRHKDLSDFALNHDIIIFVSGKTSSNGKVLYELCKSLNIRTYYISSTEELKREWFRDDDKVGVCGATSTPKWLLEDVAKKILQ